MCGVIGSYKIKNQVSLIEKASTLIRHRGPDGQGFWNDHFVSLGHTRLSIIDLSHLGHQPMVSEDGKVVISYNGEVYNFKELRQELEKLGLHFKSKTDTEVILKGYLAWGENLFLKLNGIFAFAIWDQRRETLYLVRDRFGVKPLYFARVGDGLIFASEIKAILATGLINKAINSQAVSEYLWYSNALEDRTFFQGIQKLLPGHFLKVSNNSFENHPYWQIGKQEIDYGISFHEAIKQVRESLESAVVRQLESDVPVGIFLSGGIDSSAITAFAAKHYNKKIDTYAVGFDFAEENELPKAKKVAQYFNTQHHEVFIEGQNLAEVVDHLISVHDEPFADAANIPLYLLCKELKGSLKVVLQGDGGDEIFAGYNRYELLSRDQFWHLVAKVVSPLKKFLPRKRFIELMKEPRSLRLALLLTTMIQSKPPSNLLNMKWNALLKETNPFLAYEHSYEQFNKFDSVNAMLYTDCVNLLPNTFLEKVDKPTMANSIEVRVPFLDYKLTDYVLPLPARYKVEPGNKKRLLKAALRGIVPDAILDAPKTGFGVPFGAWLKGPLAPYTKEHFFGEIGRQLFNQQKILQYWQEHTTNQKNHDILLWRLLNLGVWYRKNFD